MDFRFTVEEEDFRKEVQQFLQKELNPEWVTCSNFQIFGNDKLWLAYKTMARKLAQKGWLTIDWPEQYGGKPGSKLKKMILLEEMIYHGAPGIDPFGLKMLAPILMVYGTEEQKKRHLIPIANGEVTWCQAFTEPEAGSDLASLRTQAKEDGDHFILNGQKVWITSAHRADWAFTLARTDPQTTRHTGLSFFLVDMKTPGVTVRPLINIIGEHSFNEIFFDDVKVPKTNMVGEKNKGWYVTMSLEGFERSGIEHSAESRRFLERLIKLVNEIKDNEQFQIDQIDARNKLAELAVDVEVGRWLAYRVAWLQSKGQEVAYEAAASKVFNSELMQRIGIVGMQIAGLYGQLIPGSNWALLNGDIEKWYVSNLGRSLGGGTSEIQRNLIAQRGLGLPR
jgi:alkylation response protein AidB-like acyl-CoA dehydrogenase